MSFESEVRKQRLLALIEDSRDEGITWQDATNLLSAQFELDARGAGGAAHQFLKAAIDNNIVEKHSERYYSVQFAPKAKSERSGNAVSAMVYDDREPARPVQETDRFTNGEVHYVQSYVGTLSGVDIKVEDVWLPWYRVRNSKEFVRLYVSLEIPDPIPGMVYTDQATSYRVWYRDGKTKKSHTSQVPDNHKVILIVE